MFRLRSRISVSQPAPGELLVQISGGRRVLYGVISVVLVIAFFVGVDWQTTFGEDFSFGVVFYILLTLVCIFVAGWNSVVALDKSKHTAVFAKKLFGVPIHQRALSLGGTQHILIHSIQFLKGREVPQPGVLTNRFRSYAAKRNIYYKLFLVIDDVKYLVEDSTDTAELEHAAVAMSDFLGVEFLKEEI
jgi:hypothetical protein